MSANRIAHSLTWLGAALAWLVSTLAITEATSVPMAVIVPLTLVEVTGNAGEQAFEGLGLHTERIQGAPGAAFHPQLVTERAELVIRKGFRPEIDSYSAFYENDRRTPTGLAGYLRERGLQRIFLAGLATDYCVYYSAVDARRLGFDTVLIEAGCRAIDLAGSLDAAWAGMATAGVQRVNDLN